MKLTEPSRGKLMVVYYARAECRSSPNPHTRHTLGVGGERHGFAGSEVAPFLVAGAVISRVVGQVVSHTPMVPLPTAGSWSRPSHLRYRPSEAAGPG